MIYGVKTKKLIQNCDDRGRLMEILRNDWSEFIRFGQIYMTTVYPGVIKAWHYHKIQTDTFTCLKGMIKVVMYDAREDSQTKGQINEICIGEYNPILIQIPPLVYHGFKCLSNYESIIINIPDQLYKYENPDEFRLPAHSDKIPYNWETIDR